MTAFGRRSSFVFLWFALDVTRACPALGRIALTFIAAHAIAALLALAQAATGTLAVAAFEAETAAATPCSNDHGRLFCRVGA